MQNHGKSIHLKSTWLSSSRLRKRMSSIIPFKETNRRGIFFLYKKTILQYMTDIYQEDIPKHILQENKIRLNSFFLEQESVQKKGTQFIFRYAFYSVEKPRKITKQHLLKEYAGVPLEKRSVQPEQIPDMKQYSDIILYGDASSPEAQQQLAEYLQQHNSLKVQLSFFDKRNDSTSKDEQAIAYAELQKALFFCQKRTKNFEYNLFSSSNLCIRKKFHGIQKRDDSGLGIIG